jgi:hypothetical protein
MGNMDLTAVQFVPAFAAALLLTWWARIQLQSLVRRLRLLPPSNPDAHSFRATPLARLRLFPPDPIQQRELHLDL